jgi:hypothetical protein
MDHLIPQTKQKSALLHVAWAVIRRNPNQADDYLEPFFGEEQETSYHK